MSPRVDAALEALIPAPRLAKVAWRPYQPAGAPPRPPRPPSPVFPGGGRVGQGGAPGAQPWRQPGSTLGAPAMTMPRSGGPPATPQQGMAAAQARFSGHQPMAQPQFTPPAPPQVQRAPALPQGGVPGTRAFGGSGTGTATSTPGGWVSPRAQAAMARDAEVLRAERAAAAAVPVAAPARPSFERLNDRGVNLNTASNDDMRAWLRSQGLL